MGGEPFTTSKEALLASVGATGACFLYNGEVGGLSGVPCADPAAVGDVHLCSHRLALSTRDVELRDGTTVPALCLTTIHHTARATTINLVTDDFAVVEERECGCELGTLGLSTHLHSIRSFEKLTGEGVSFLGESLITLVERVLPARYGGALTDYQFVERERDGITRLALRASSRVGPLDASAVVETVLGHLDATDGRAQAMASLWRAAGTIEVVREEPELTRNGKVLPLALAATERRIRDRRLAGEPLADVDGGPSVHQPFALEERHVLGGAEGDDGVRVVTGERGLRHVVGGRADDRDLARRREVEVESTKGPAERGRRPRHEVADEPQDGDGVALELVVAVDPREAQQHVREHRVAGRRRVVVEVLRAHDERLAVGGREEEASALVVAEQLDGEQREAARLLEPAQLAGGDVQLVEPVRDVRVVVEVARAGRPAFPVAPPEAALCRQRAEQELRQAAGGCQPVVALEPPGRLRQCGERQAVPRRDRLVVEPGLRARPALSSSRARSSGSSSPLMIERPCSNGSSSSAGTPSSAVHVYVSPSTPSVSASWDDANAPSGSRRSRSMYSTVSSTTSR